MEQQSHQPSAEACDTKPAPSSTQNNSSSPTDQNSHHDELINFVSESWNAIYQDFENGTQGNNGHFHIQFYEERHSDKLKEFKPFDLEAWQKKQTI